MINKKLLGILLVLALFILSAIIINIDLASAWGGSCEGANCCIAQCSGGQRQILQSLSESKSCEGSRLVSEIVYQTGVAGVNGWADVISCVCTETLRNSNSCNEENNNYNNDYNYNDYNHDGSNDYSHNYNDNQAPRTTNVQTSSLAESSVTITWNTDKRTDSEIEYGKTRSLGISKLSNTLTQSHSIRLTGLQSDTTYYFSITSCDYNNNCKTEGTFSFRTLESSSNCNENYNDYYDNNCDNYNEGNNCHKTYSSTSTSTNTNTIDELSLYYLMQQANSQKVVIIPQTTTPTTRSAISTSNFNPWYILVILLIILILIFAALIFRVMTKNNS